MKHGHGKTRSKLKRMAVAMTLIGIFLAFVCLKRIETEPYFTQEYYARSTGSLSRHSGSKQLKYSYGKNLHYTGNTFEACCVGILLCKGKGNIIDVNQFWDNRYSIRVSGTYNTISNNRFDTYADQSSQPYCLGECCIKLRSPVGSVISCNTINENIRAIELDGCSAVNIANNSVCIPNPNRASPFGYSLIEGFFIEAKSNPKNYTSLPAKLKKINAGLIIADNCWVFSDGFPFAPTTGKAAIALIVSSESGKLYGLAVGNGSQPFGEGTGQKIEPMPVFYFEEDNIEKTSLSTFKTSDF